MTRVSKDKLTPAATNEAGSSDSEDHDKRLKTDASELAQLIYDIYLEEKAALAKLN